MNTEILNKFSQIRLEIETNPNPYVDLEKLQVSDSANVKLDKFYMTNFSHQTIDTIEKIELSNFEMYCIDAISGDKIIYPTQDYTLFSVKDRILIAFHNYKTFTPKTYIYAEMDGGRQLIQIPLFEEVQRFFHMGKDHSWGSFCFFNSRIVEPADINPLRERCDINDYGPIFWNDSGETNEGATHNSFAESVDISRLQEFYVIMSVPGIGNIVYLRLNPINGTLLSDNYNNDAVLPAVTRTMFELIKLIDEWASVSEEPWNNTQTISKKAKDFIQALNMPDNIKSEIELLQTDMQIYRYLSGNANARQRPPIEEVALMPESVYNWFKEQFCYRRFENMILYHPSFN
jgi:hypothetical protein